MLPTPDYEIRSAFIGRTVTGRQRAADDTVRCRCPSGRSSLDLVVAYATATAPPSVVTAGLFLASEVFVEITVIFWSRLHGDHAGLHVRGKGRLSWRPRFHSSFSVRLARSRGAASPAVNERGTHQTAAEGDPGVAE